MYADWFGSFVALWVYLIASAQAQAQPLFGHAESIEAKVANADLVYIGRITAFDGGNSAEAPREYKVTFDVEETLKQPLFEVESHRRLQLRVFGPASTLAGLKDRGTRLLVAVDDRIPGATTMIELASNVEVLTADLKLLRDPDAVVQAAKEMVRRMPSLARRTHTFGLEVPREVVAGTDWQKYYETGGHIILNVPVEASLEVRALNYIRSDGYRQRQEGVQALRYFKTEENIARAKTLLNDPGWAFVYHAEENKGVEVRIYGVRQEAYLTLKAWGVDVEKPIIREEVRK